MVEDLAGIRGKLIVLADQGPGGRGEGLYNGGGIRGLGHGQFGHIGKLALEVIKLGAQGPGFGAVGGAQLKVEGDDFAGEFMEFILPISP